MDYEQKRRNDPQRKAYMRDYLREYRETHGRKLALYVRAWRLLNRDKVGEYRSRYKQSDEGRMVNAAAARKWRLGNPNINSAHVAVRREKRNNRMITRTCTAKGCSSDGVAHHSDYNEPLSVTWLCPIHHAAWHRVFMAEKRNEQALSVEKHLQQET